MRCSWNEKTEVGSEWKVKWWNKHQGENSDESDNSASLDAVKSKRQWCICLLGGLSKWEVDDESVSVI